MLSHAQEWCFTLLTITTVAFDSQDYESQVLQEARLIFAEHDQDGNGLISTEEAQTRCADDHESCADWEKHGKCVNNAAAYMRTKCYKSCGLCVGDWLGALDPKQDADGDGSFTFSELVQSVFSRLAAVWYMPHRVTPQLFSAEPLPRDWFDPALRMTLEALDAGSGSVAAAQALQPLVHEEAAGVFSFPMFTEDFCRRFLDEIDRFKLLDVPVQ